jgi:hypothetical protein
VEEVERLQYQGGLKLQAKTLAVLPHSLEGHSMTYDVPKILKLIRHLKFVKLNLKCHLSVAYQIATQIMRLLQIK